MAANHAATGLAWRDDVPSWARGFVDAPVTYLTHPDQKPVGYNPPQGSGLPERKGEFGAFHVRVHDARAVADTLSLDREGFVLARRPSAVICAATAAASAVRARQFTATSAPAPDKASAIARPMPRLAPVTNATLPAISLIGTPTVCLLTKHTPGAASAPTPSAGRSSGQTVPLPALGSRC